MSALSELSQFARQILWWLFHPVTRYAAAWLLAFGLAYSATSVTWDRRWDTERPHSVTINLGFTEFDCELGTTDGHTTIDFGGQWTMGRMLVTGRGWNLFERHHLRLMLAENYPLEEQPLKQQIGEDRT